VHRSRPAVPSFPCEALGPFWCRWVAEEARAFNAPVDYTAGSLLAVGAALIGNACHGRIGRWQEATCLWIGKVGLPSSNKSPGGDAVMIPLAAVEKHMARAFPEALRRWKAKEAAAKAAENAHAAAVARAAKANKEPPPAPDLDLPPKPVRPGVRLGDTTVEKAQVNLAERPKGCLVHYDELAGWWGTHNRYNTSSGPFWIEAYGGRAYVVERMTREDVVIPNLTVSVLGGTQPARLASMMADTADDGLIARFLWVWPDRVPEFTLSTAPGSDEAADRLCRLADLEMARGVDGQPTPRFVEFDPDAALCLQDFARRMQARERRAQGMMVSALGKARGQAMRLALVLQYLWWCGSDQPEPETVSLAAMEHAVGLLENYFLAMAEAVYGGLDDPQERRSARVLAEWILETRPTVVNVRAIRDEEHLPGLYRTDAVKGAIRYLAEAGWLIAAERTGAPGRPRGDWIVNAKVYRPRA